MSTEIFVRQIRHAWRWAVASTLFGTSVSILEYLASGNAWPFRLTAVCAAVAWINLVIQTRLLRSVSNVGAG
jgi:hypothetical protein